MIEYERCFPVDPYEKFFQDTFPELYYSGETRVKSSPAIGFGTQYGWFTVLYRLSTKLKPLAIKHNELNPDSPFKIAQIKEKFGTLRFYVGQVDESVSKEVILAIEQAVEESLVTCELCGLPGELRNTRWIKVLCDNCYKESQDNHSKYDAKW